MSWFNNLKTASITQNRDHGRQEQALSQRVSLFRVAEGSARVARLPPRAPGASMGLGLETAA